MAKIHYTKSSITELEISYATDAVTHGWGDRCYEYICRFEESFKQHLGVKSLPLAVQERCTWV
jgi:perosamine synthetase